MIDLTRIDLATEEDKKFHIDDWARLFKDRQIDDYSRQLSDQKKQLEEQQAEIERLKSLLEEKN